MKKIILMSAAAVMTLSINAQKLKENEVPQPVTTAFKKVQPSAKEVKWEKEKSGNYEVEFETGETEQTMTLDPNGNVLETEIELAVSELPATAKNYISENYKGIKIKETAKITDAKGLITYEAEIKGKDLIFDSTGKFIKEE